MGTQLQYDFLVSIAEKIIYSPDNEFRLDLRELDALDFMVVSLLCLNCLKNILVRKQCLSKKLFLPIQKTKKGILVKRRDRIALTCSY